MKIQANITFIRPSQTHEPLIEAVGIQEINMEDVSGFEFTDNGIIVHFNNATDNFIPLRDNNSVSGDDWRFVNLAITRKFLNVDLSK